MYKGTVFHIQTEDSGVKNPHVITLLFHKGNIISRKRRDYDDILKFERLEEVVRDRMQEQHKQMLRELKSGTYDHYLGTMSHKAGEEKPASPPPPAPSEAPKVGEIPEEKPAQKTLEIKEDTELSDEDIFGADIISNKSLDEVILSYLAKDIDEE